MHHAVMGAAEAEGFELMVGVADEIAVGEEQQFDDIPAQIALARGWRARVRSSRISACHGVREIYVSHIDISWVQCYKTIYPDEILDRFARGDLSKRLETAKWRRQPRIDLPCDCRAACRQTYWTSASGKSVSSPGRLLWKWPVAGASEKSKPPRRKAPIAPIRERAHGDFVG